MITTVIIVLVILYFLKDLFSDIRSVNPLDAAKQESPVVEGKFTPKTLCKYNGSDDPKIFMAVKGRVFDVSQGATFYGPGGPYENFAGRDASRGLAKNSFELELLTPLDQPLDTLEDLTPEERESLDSWEEHFENKYKIIGTLHGENEK
ncbi:Dihydrodipicolinate synthase [Yamadazyma tenuis]|uniref:Cytochrome b5 n=1 Tax=Candida tenuis (strain ATCC 10573 / BCRC 21748 / CBS 615 / JCM 9827 / NBRC 10315 / NRRL Y-1498 / VKM Y-70) TaxID=590646 RepID=G3B3M0_CANTC|nr:cytochrome b5 [Yamadazyma tenuis ATCC 10573]EGV64185.1 cytochrome b5 [Yamadazyma tenuis ATCC 10573]WEJ96156.1 Dihydrodipicolinate synthase [Yamadazyma tenuis]